MTFNEIKGRWYYLDGNYISSENFNAGYLWQGKSYYEVLRVINGKPLFLKDHIERFQVTILNFRDQIIPDQINFKEIITKLVSINNIESGNIKIVVNIFEKISLYIYFISHYYPAQDDYINGVKIITCKFERNQPAIKAVNRSLREKSETLIKELGIYDILLVNKNGNITECSKSNIFLIKDNQLFTPPLETVLAGITRKYVIRICINKKIEYHEHEIPLKAVSSFDAIFITGTSPKVLPVRQIDLNKFQVNHPVTSLIMTEYEKIIHENIGI